MPYCLDISHSYSYLRNGKLNFHKTLIRLFCYPYCLNSYAFYYVLSELIRYRIILCRCTIMQKLLYNEYEPQHHRVTTVRSPDDICIVIAIE